MCLLKTLRRSTKCLAAWMAVVALLMLPVYAQAQTTTANISLTTLAAGKISVAPATISLTNSSGTAFGNYTTATPTSVVVSYWIRTRSAGTGTVTVYASADFTPAGGPSIASPPTAGDALTYTCTGATLGTGCSSALTVTTVSGSATNVVSIGALACTGGGGSCSTAIPNTVNLGFALTNDYKYKTGTYTATLRFTISET